MYRTQPDLSSLVELPLLTDESVNLTAVQRRQINAEVNISGDTPDVPDYLHAILCQVGLPRKDPRALVFERRNGNAVIRLEAGQQFVNSRKGFKALPLPYGAKPRLMLYHICSEAIRTQNRVIELGSSVACFLDRLGLSSCGNEYSRFKQQITALCGVRMILGYDDGIRSTTMNTNPVYRFDAWTHFDGRQLGFWTGELEIASDFYDTLVEHAVPLDPRAIRALQHSALKLDIYTWLAHRLHRINTRSGVRVSWKNLRDQFGQEYKNPKDFKKTFVDALNAVLGVYPTARVEREIGVLRLYPSPPPIPKIQSSVVLPRASA